MEKKYIRKAFLFFIFINAQNSVFSLTMQNFLTAIKAGAVRSANNIKYYTVQSTNFLVDKTVMIKNMIMKKLQKRRYNLLMEAELNEIITVIGKALNNNEGDFVVGHSFSELVLLKHIYKNIDTSSINFSFEAMAKALQLYLKKYCFNKETAKQSPEFIVSFLKNEFNTLNKNLLRQTIASEECKKFLLHAYNEQLRLLGLLHVRK